MKKLLTLVLALTFVSSSALNITAKANTTNAPKQSNVSSTAVDLKYNSIDEIKQKINNIFQSNKAQIIKMVKEIKDLQCKDEAYMLRYGSCGVSSIVFQKILIDNGIYVETRMDSQMYSGHEYNLLRAKMSDGSIKHIVIDLTYRQFLRNYFRQLCGTNPSEEDIDNKILQSNLPEILVYEFEDKSQIEKQLSPVLPGTVTSDTFTALRNAYESQQYPELALQTIHTRYLTQDMINTLQKGVDIPNPILAPIYLRGSFNNWKANNQFTYNGNGVFETKVYLDSSKNNGEYEFKVADQGWSKYNFGLYSSTPISPTSNISYNHSTVQTFMNNGSNTQNIHLKVYNSGTYIFRVDIGSGVNSPLVRVIPT